MRLRRSGTISTVGEGGEGDPQAEDGSSRDGPREGTVTRAHLLLARSLRRRHRQSCVSELCSVDELRSQVQR